MTDCHPIHISKSAIAALTFPAAPPNPGFSAWLFLHGVLKTLHERNSQRSILPSCICRANTTCCFCPTITTCCSITLLAKRMRTIQSLLIFAALVTCSAMADVRPDVVNSLVTELPALELTSPSSNMGIPERGAVADLLALGIDAVPFLIPHLSNMAMTKSYRVHGSGRKEQISVNEFVGHVITRSCGHYFYIASGESVSEHLGDKPLKNPETIALYQEQVKRWYDHYGRWQESEGKWGQGANLDNFFD